MSKRGSRVHKLAKLPDWEQVLSAAARLQGLFPDAVLVGGTAAALYAGHRMSADADHVLTDLRGRFDGVLGELESVAGWRTARVQRPVLILGNLDGIETGVRQLIREQPLEVVTIESGGQRLRVPSEAEMLRIKAVLILKRNATRDYLDFIAMADRMSLDEVVAAMRPFDALYPQSNGESALQQLQVQIATPLPFDLDAIALAEYKHLDPKWHDWRQVSERSAALATALFDRLCES